MRTNLLCSYLILSIVIIINNNYRAIPYFCLQIIMNKACSISDWSFTIRKIPKNLKFQGNTLFLQVRFSLIYEYCSSYGGYIFIKFDLQWEKTNADKGMAEWQSAES